jgi:hypothetical protein
MNGKALVSAVPVTIRVCQSHQYPEPLIPRRAGSGALHFGGADHRLQAPPALSQPTPLSCRVEKVEGLLDN